MNAIRAYHIVRVIAHCGIVHAEALYGRDACNAARFTMRANVARKQAERARMHGAGLKHASRQSTYLRHPEPIARFCEKHSKRQYRAALRYDRTAYRADILAEFHECLQADRAAQVEYAHAAHA